ncbi:hypothetical protein CO613_09895 [Lysobacteraceae bacterium NML07-0707]|nr:hypothetical protein CO613_09895 [Xanthomonadaceae bacterium NML07-0707]
MQDCANIEWNWIVEVAVGIDAGRLAGDIHLTTDRNTTIKRFSRFDSRRNDNATAGNRGARQHRAQLGWDVF